MKKIFILLPLLALAVVSIGQSDKYKISFRVSPNLSWMKPDNKNIESGGTVLRYGFGMATDILFTDNYAIGTGLEITRMGGELTYLSTGIIDNKERIWETKRTYNLGYAEIPLTLKLRTNEIGYMTYYGQFGLSLGVNIRAKADNELDYLYDKNSGSSSVSWDESTLPSLSTTDDDIKDDIQIFRTALIAGFGTEYNLAGSTSLTFGITYNGGFSNSLKNKGVQKDDRGSVVYQDQAPVTYKLAAMSNYFALNIGILF